MITLLGSRGESAQPGGSDARDAATFSGSLPTRRSAHHLIVEPVAIGSYLHSTAVGLRLQLHPCRAESAEDGVWRSCDTSPAKVVRVIMLHILARSVI